MNDKQIRQLYQRYLNGETSEQENHQLRQELANPANQELAEALLHDSFANEPAAPELSEAQQQQILANIFRQEPKVKRLWPRIAAAAAILVFLSVGGYFYLHKPTEQVANKKGIEFVNDIAPGRNEAVLTLANGRKITLSTAASGRIATQANMVINKSEKGALNYQRQSGTAENATLINTLSTQMGGETSLTLADGTEVKLDAGSSITYPVAFNGKERKVSITGQAYFKVKHNSKQPFFVTAGGQTIEDIGTEFNVNSYSDTKTTLIEGKITVNGQPLVPGQQATLKQDKLLISQGDPEEAAAWANGYFRFNNEDIHQVMDKISRWYNIEAVYDKNITSEGFTGTVSRYKNISQVFYMLGYSNKVHFKIEGRRVTVMK